MTTMIETRLKVISRSERTEHFTSLSFVSITLLISPYIIEDIQINTRSVFCNALNPSRMSSNSSISTDLALLLKDLESCEGKFAACSSNGIPPSPSSTSIETLFDTNMLIARLKRPSKQIEMIVYGKTAHIIREVSV